MARTAHIAQRIAMAAVVGIVAAVFMSSSVLAGVVALATMLFVVIDMFAFARGDAADDLPGELATPARINVDLRRRS